MKAIKSPYNYGLDIIVKNDMNPKVILSQNDKMFDMIQNWIIVDVEIIDAIF